MLGRRRRRRRYILISIFFVMLLCSLLLLTTTSATSSPKRYGLLIGIAIDLNNDINRNCLRSQQKLLCSLLYYRAILLLYNKISLYSSPLNKGSHAGSLTGVCLVSSSTLVGTYFLSMTTRNMYSLNHSSVMMRWPL